MSKNVIINLRDPFAGHRGRVDRITLREPRAGDYFALGDPTQLARTPSGEMRVVIRQDTVNKYLERLIIDPDPLLALGQMSLADGLAVQNALLDFFSEAALKGEPSGEAADGVGPAAAAG